MIDEASYLCDSCGEETAVVVDPGGGTRQEFVEDCPVCCNPSVIQVEIDPSGEVRVWGRAEQDQA